MNRITHPYQATDRLKNMTPMDPESQRLENEFNSKLDQWIARQSILFQCKHASSAGSILPRLLSLGFKLLVLLAVCLGIFWIYLIKRPENKSFNRKITEQIKEGTYANSVEVGGVSRYKGGLLSGQLKINKIELKSSDKSFYTDWYEMVTVRDGGVDYQEEKKFNLKLNSIIVSPLGIGDGLFNEWSGKSINIENLKCHLRTGGNTDDEAKASYQTLFHNFTELSVQNITINNAHIKWGYDISEGNIKGASITAIRSGDVWEITAKGGTFSHGWLQNTRLQNMVMKCYKDGFIEITEAALKIGKGKLNFNANIQMKSQPTVEGSYDFTSINVIDLIGQEYESHIDGVIKGTGKLSGSLNSSEGIICKTHVELKAPDLIKKKSDKNNLDLASNQPRSPEDSELILRAKFPLLATLQRLNPVFSYSVLRFNNGSFDIEQNSGNTIVSNIDIRSGNFVLISGAFEYLWQAPEETTDLNNSGKEFNSMYDDKKEAEATEETEEEEKKPDIKTFSGELKLGFVPQVFERNPEITEVYPVDEETIRIWLPLKMTGVLQTVTVNLAQELQDIVKKKRDKDNK